MKNTTKMARFAQVVSDHFIDNHMNTEEHAHSNTINSAPQRYTLLAIDYEHIQENDYNNWKLIKYEELQIIVFVHFLSSMPKRLRRVLQYDSQVFYVPSNMTKEEVKRIDKIYSNELAKIHYAYAVKIDETGQPIAIEPCYQSKVYHFNIGHSDQKNSSCHDDNTNNNNARKTCRLM